MSWKIKLNCRSAIQVNFGWLASMLGNEELLMLNIGTKVFIKNLHKEDRPETQQQHRQGLRYITCEYGYIVDCADNGYYLVAHEDDMIHHEDDVEEYGVGWVDEMDKYIGRTARVADTDSYPDVYRLEDVRWNWHAVNLEPVSEFVGY